MICLVWFDVVSVISSQSVLLVEETKGLGENVVHCMLSRSLLVLVNLVIVLSVLRFTDSDYPFGILKFFISKLSKHIIIEYKRGCHGCDCMVVGFTTTYAISAYHH
jgi:hypothetical protein